MIKIIIIIKINIFTFRVIRIGEIIFSAKVYHISSLNIVFHSLSKYLSSPLIYIYIYSVLQFVGHCNFRYQVSFLMYTYYHENGARYIKKHEAIIRAIRNANIREKCIRVKYSLRSSHLSPRDLHISAIVYFPTCASASERRARKYSILSPNKSSDLFLPFIRPREKKRLRKSTS